MERCVQPELLDQLPSEDPRALRSRRDLRRINFLMGHARILRRLFNEHGHSPPRILAELGAGDGTFFLNLLRHWGKSASGEVWLIDPHPAVSSETTNQFQQLGWNLRVVATTAQEWLANPESPRADWMLANLFLHHFHELPLRALFSQIAEKTHLFAACEPRRTWPGWIAANLLPAAGCSMITRDDAAISVRAGFKPGELTSHWPKPSGWKILDQPRGLFSQIFLAVRNQSDFAG